MRIVGKRVDSQQDYVLVSVGGSVVAALRPGQCYGSAGVPTAVVCTEAQWRVAWADLHPAPTPPPTPPANWRLQCLAMGALSQPLLPPGGLEALTAALEQCSTVPSQYFAALGLFLSIGGTQGQIDAWCVANPNG